MKWAHGGFRALSSLVSEGVRLRTRKRKGKKTRGEKKARSVGSNYSPRGGRPLRALLTPHEVADPFVPY